MPRGYDLSPFNKYKLVSGETAVELRPMLRLRVAQEFRPRDLCKGANIVEQTGLLERAAGARPSKRCCSA